MIWELPDFFFGGGEFGVLEIFSSGRNNYRLFCEVRKELERKLERNHVSNKNMLLFNTMAYKFELNMETIKLT